MKYVLNIVYEEINIACHDVLHARVTVASKVPNKERKRDGGDVLIRQ